MSSVLCRLRQGKASPTWGFTALLKTGSGPILTPWQLPVSPYEGQIFPCESTGRKRDVLSTSVKSREAFQPNPGSAPFLVWLWTHYFSTESHLQKRDRIKWSLWGLSVTADLRGWDSLVLPWAISKFPCEDPSCPHVFWAFLEVGLEAKAPSS